MMRVTPLKSGLVFRESTYTGQLSMKMHEDTLTQVIFLLEGSVQHGSPQETVQLLPSTLVFLPAGSPHAAHFHQVARAFELNVLPPFEDRLQQAELTFTQQQVHTSGAPTWLMMRLYRELQNPDHLTPLLVEGLTLELFVTLGRINRGDSDTTPPHWLQTARDFLHAHFTQSLSLEQVATEARVHPAHLARSFRQHYHCTIGDYVRQLRIAHACTQLRRSETSLLTLALELGFADQGHFSRTFKQLTGLTPTAFRKSVGSATLR